MLYGSMSSRFVIWIVLLSAALMLESCAFRPVKRSKNITYLSGDGTGNRDPQELNVFAPWNKKQLHPVLIYIYGGNWTSGRKSLYNFFGSRWARKGVVTVIVDYPKYPQAKYDEMTLDIALAVKWVKEHIRDYGGDPNRIYISGHSAGGQMAALVSIRPDYFERVGISNPIKGIILIDPAGLDMYGYMKEVGNGPNDTYPQIFSTDTNTQKYSAALYQVRPGIPPMLLYAGGRSYPAIATSVRKMNDSLTKYEVPHTYYFLKRKKHVGMITQFFNSYSPRYREIKQFMKQHP